MNISNAFFCFSKLVNFSSWTRANLIVGFGLKIAFFPILRSRAQFWDGWLVFFVWTMVFLEAQMNISNAFFSFLKLVNFWSGTRVALNVVFGLKIAFFFQFCVVGHNFESVGWVFECELRFFLKLRWISPTHFFVFRSRSIFRAGQGLT